MSSIKQDEVLVAGHRACPGCGAILALKYALNALGRNVIVHVATSCMEVSIMGGGVFPRGEYPLTVPSLHTAFETSGAVVSGMDVGLRALGKRQGVNLVAIAGDGGTADIGLQTLSGAAERGHDFIYICYDNEAYMNTGNQRSSATPFAADTTTCPVGCVVKGKPQFQKDLAAIITAHNIPYVAQACGSFWKDLTAKVEKALSANGPSFINVLSPCVLGWKYPTDETIEIGKLAVDTCFWPLYEVVEGNYRLTYVPSQKKPLGEWTKRQGRFRHLHEPGGEGLLEKAQREVDRKWEHLLAISEKPAKPGKQPKEASQ